MIDKQEFQIGDQVQKEQEFTSEHFGVRKEMCLFYIVGVHLTSTEKGTEYLYDLALRLPDAYLDEKVVYQKQRPEKDFIAVPEGEPE